jgi:hypothetical protein
MTSLKLTEDSSKRYAAFLKSQEFNEGLPDSKSSYWQHHASLVSADLKKATVLVRGCSGIYITPSLRPGASIKFVFTRNGLLGRLQRVPRAILVAIGRRLLRWFPIHIGGPVFLSYPQAFDAVMQNKEIAGAIRSPYRIDHSALALVDGVFSDTHSLSEHYRGWVGLSPSWNIIIQYYLYNILRGNAEPEKLSTILEIGGGNGNFASLCLHDLPYTRVILVDLPEMLSVSIPFLANLFPTARLGLPNEFRENGWNDDFDIAFLTPGQISLIPDDTVDVSVNISSFQEMTHPQIAAYFRLIQRVTHNSGLFLCMNRVEKIPAGPDSQNTVYDDPPNRFADYPWVSTNELLVYEVCRLIRLVQLDDVMIRLERVCKSVIDPD